MILAIPVENPKLIKTIYLGVDPGQSGGIGILNTPNGADAFGFKDLTESDIWERLQEIKQVNDIEGYRTRAYLEAVHSMPKQGVASSFKFGASWGFLKGILTASGIPFELVSPQKWQGYLGCKTGGDKNITKQFAQRLYPEIKVTHALADALLIATYGQRVSGGRL